MAEVGGGQKDDGPALNRTNNRVTKQSESYPLEIISEAHVFDHLDRAARRNSTIPKGACDMLIPDEAKVKFREQVKNLFHW